MITYVWLSCICMLSNKLLHLDIVHMLHLWLISYNICGIDMRPNWSCIRKKSKKKICPVTFGPPCIFKYYNKPSRANNKEYLYYLFSFYHVLRSNYIFDRTCSFLKSNNQMNSTERHSSVNRKVSIDVLVFKKSNTPHE
jgi:hypothetical protein